MFLGLEPATFGKCLLTQPRFTRTARLARRILRDAFSAQGHYYVLVVPSLEPYTTTSTLNSENPPITTGFLRLA